MLRLASRGLFSYPKTGPCTARYFHRATLDFITYDATGKLVTEGLSGYIGNPGESYVIVPTKVGNAFRAASPVASSAATAAQDKCKLTFFHDSKHFGFEPESYPRLYVPNELPRQTESNTSSATLFLTGVTHEIVLDGTSDAKFAEDSSASAKKLAPVLEMLKHM
ncbi:hypothetical protein BP00DRAFT_445015 [Aspergillus indologenus CBS 114.80]|uniref:Uncharacterized protein n=1 Tax=Aspergillus indologenus CBS 114.80 TaxID=1450541 RepID=A0A2V5ICW3_9EURO|nr:hypothetical protein BP00DRAFT_445015 [Aspergillus indologenus CBS 114.80]